MQENFIKIREYFRKRGITKVPDKIYSKANHQLKKNKFDQFKRINGRLYINEHYEDEVLREVNEAQELYHEAKDAFGDGRFFSAEISKHTGFATSRINSYLYEFRFARPNLRKIYVSAFKKIIAEYSKK